MRLTNTLVFSRASDPEEKTTKRFGFPILLYPLDGKRPILVR